MKKYKTPHILAESKVYGVIPAVAAATGVASAAKMAGVSIGVVAAGIGALMGLKQDSKFDTLTIPALEPVI